MPTRRHPPDPRAKQTSLIVLFIGNSFTARNDLPGLIARLAEARGVHLEHRLISAGGASLRMHWNKGVALEAIRTGKFDYVVLQEQSTLPIKNPTRMHENIRLFDDAIRASGSKTALYLTWARANAPGPKSQEAITDAYTSIGREIGATLVPVGIAWQRFLASTSTLRVENADAERRATQIILHDKDQSHPTLAGSYLAACVFFATLFGESPVGIEAEAKGLTAQDAHLLQRAATDAMQ